MMRILIHAQKGGVGKTTTAANLGAGLVRGQHVPRVALVDGDPQQHLSGMFGMEPDGSGAVIGEPGLFVQPEDAAQIDADLTIYDSAPGWSDATADLISRVDLVICPLEPDFLGLSGVGRLLSRMNEAGLPRDRLRLLLCRFNPRLSLHNEVRDRLVARFAGLVLPVEIRTSIRIAEAPGHRRTVFAHAPGSTGAKDYASLARVVMRAFHAGQEAA